MKESRSSTTAEQVALSRAIETRKKPEERICADPFAESFLSAKYKSLLVARPLRDAVEAVIESRFAGHHYYVIARTRCVDEFLESQLSGTPQQLVILGAGYDSRAHRFSDLLTGVSVFEVDHPATSAAKRAKIGRLGLTDRVVYVPVDFNRQTVPDRLREAGYRDGCRTLFLWEGVAPYLSAEAVDDVLHFMVSSADSGSAVMFDYVLASVLDGTCQMRGARSEFDKMAKTSEPFTFGIVPGTMAQFLAERGFTEVVDVGADDLKASYFGRYPNRYIKPWWRIVSALLP